MRERGSYSIESHINNKAVCKIEILILPFRTPFRDLRSPARAPCPLDLKPPDNRAPFLALLFELWHTKGNRAQETTRLPESSGHRCLPIRMSSVSEKMQRELTQVESQIYDLETIFLSTNRYGHLLATQLRGK